MGWFELGVKQQENEREQKALQALQRSIDIDPQHLPTWLALAISYTNDNNRYGTYEAIYQWIDRNETFRDVVSQFRAENPLATDVPITDKFRHLIDCLIVMARRDSNGSVDADIQIALAVLLNTSEVSTKALQSTDMGH